MLVSQTWLLAVEESDLSFTSLTSLIQRSLLVAGLGPGSPISQRVLFLGVWEKLYSSQAFKI